MPSDVLVALHKMSGDFLAEHQEIRGTRELTESAASITVPSATADGFDVYFQIRSTGDWIIGTGVGWHENGSDATIATVRTGLDSVRELLCASTRIREFRSAGKPYRWLRERRSSGTWQGAGDTVLIFWNYFGARSERVYQNAALPLQHNGT